MAKTMDDMEKDWIEYKDDNLSEHHPNSREYLKAYLIFKAGWSAREQSSWCFDMDKAPIGKICDVAVSDNGELSVMRSSLGDGVCPDTGKDFGTGKLWSNINEYFVTPYAWRLKSTPPQPPKEYSNG